MIRNNRQEPAADSPRFPGLVVLLLFAIVFQATFSVGGLLFSPARLLCLILVPILLVRLLARHYGPVTAVDLLVFAHLGWLTLTVFLNHPTGVAITYTGSNIILILGGYLTARTMVRSVAEMRGTMLMLIGLVLFSLPFALLESRTGTMTLARLIDLLPGLSGSRDVNYQPRFGFNRVQFLFVHPIHYGLFCSCAFAVCYIGQRGWLRASLRLPMAAGIGLATFLSVSSGPFLSLAGQAFLILWARILRPLRYKWQLLGGLSAVLYVVLEAISDRPAIYAIVSRLAFSSSTANDRLLLLDYGIAQVGRNPIFGIGFNPFPLPHWMSGSIDNFWLLLCIVFGLPTFLLLMAALGVMFLRLARIQGASAGFNDMRLAWTITMISLMLTLVTVAIWTEMLSLFYFMIGCGVWMTQHVPAAPSAVGEQAPVAAAGAGRVSAHSRFPLRARPLPGPPQT